ncbi:hypothetical protein P7D22_04220 [Lichenihabitans sp. Uapishka_5]|uniref:hypothetical protein n=1 Tax=Lichenihabitans sp. Uapishka_5 TaxID=3037302 RepID=UPI0029E7D14E|nr:hypothetical protein [Lichenihabitans sp. Uapishka_5]MDX7950383.1 hypothetical protein [Lichenihabitans sp. Uapishka_5]
MRNLNRAALVALATVSVLSVAPAAFAQPYGYGNPPVVVGMAPPLEGRPLTVMPRQRYNPYDNGLGTVVTAPLNVAGELVALPFRVVNAVFPADPRSPLSFIGAPVAAVGQAVQYPFHVVQAPFGDRTIYGQ